jgi:hypothetical protein
MTVAIKYDAARRRYRQPAAALILRNLGVVLSADELEVIEPYAEQGQQEHYKTLHDPKPAAEVLRGVFEFHGKANSEQQSAVSKAVTIRKRTTDNAHGAG